MRKTRNVRSGLVVVSLCLALVGCLLLSEPVHSSQPKRSVESREDCKGDDETGKNNGQEEPERLSAGPAAARADKPETVASNASNEEESPQKTGTTEVPVSAPSSCSGSTCSYRRHCGKAPLGTMAPTIYGTPRSAFEPYMIGATPQNYGDWPSFASFVIQDPNNVSSICGGVLITKRHILTVNSCVSSSTSGPQQVVLTSVLLGEHERDVEDAHETHYEIESVCRAKGYRIEQDMLYHDYAVVTLKKDVEFNDYTQPACLPYEPEYEHPASPENFQHCYMIGLGDVALASPDRTSVSAPFIMSMPVTFRKCRPPYEDDENRACVVRTSSQPGAACKGDEGDPILCLNPRTHRWTLAGMVSTTNATCVAGTISIRKQIVVTNVQGLLGTIKKDCEI